MEGCRDRGRGKGVMEGEGDSQKMRKKGGVVCSKNKLCRIKRNYQTDK